MSTTKENAAKLSISSVCLLILIKVAASFITGSISIRADAVHSSLDLIAAVTTFIGVKISGKPADEHHPFGHGKAENISSTVVAGLIFTAGGIIIYTAVRRLIIGAPLESIGIGIYITTAAIIVNILISRYLSKVARATDSPALEADAHHLFSDVLSSCAVLVGLIAVQITGLNILDPIIALLVALFILKVGYDTLRKSFGGLVDVSLPKTEEMEIKSCIIEHYSEVVSFHRLRTRKAGSQRYIDLHLVMPKNNSVDEAHRMCSHLEQDIENRLHHASVTIHVEPCGIECEQCQVSCSLRKRSP
ncbi:cation diffusion facilitator family transporter [Chloroflexota bacterium]